MIGSFLNINHESKASWVTGNDQIGFIKESGQAYRFTIVTEFEALQISVNTVFRVAVLQEWNLNGRDCKQIVYLVMNGSMVHCTQVDFFIVRL